MQIFIDSADLNEIRQAWDWGIIDGVTTNPSLVGKTGLQFKDVVKEIFKTVNGPVSLEVVATEFDGMVKEGRALAKFHKNAIVKLPCTPTGIKALNVLNREKIKVNMTLVFSVQQALLAAKAGATYISPFAGRLDDLGQDGSMVVEEIVTMIKNYNFSSKVLFSSVRSTEHVRRALLMGADVATMPFDIIEQLFHHDLTDKGLQKFLDDWKASGQKPLV